jgi:hypothetical protein
VLVVYPGGVPDSATSYPEAAPHGWSSDFRAFRETPAAYIRQSLADFIRDASAEQVRAWDESIPPLQREVGEVIDRDRRATEFAAILEYELPLEYRRPDVILLLARSVMVLELKGKSWIDQADVDQAAGYARDLRAYHRECGDRPVKPVLVLMRALGHLAANAGVDVVGPDALDELAAAEDAVGAPGGAPARIDPALFLAEDAYRPLPSLVEAARELLERGDLRRIHRAWAATDPTLEALTSIAKEAARTRTRHLVLVTGLPGAGKTLVGLQLAHARFLDEIAVPRADGRPVAPAVFLSGNGPLVQVLQYELRGAGGSGKAFVRDVKAYVDRYTRRPDLVPPEHVLIFDEAQRAFDAAQVAITHKGAGDGKSEPEHFVEFAERVPEWCVVVGLIGTGQEIHTGEEGGLGQWRTAIDGVGRDGAWQVHVPPSVASAFEGYPSVSVDPTLHLGLELRFHLTTDVHAYVAALLGESDGVDLAALGTRLDAAGFHLRITRDLEAAKAYLRTRYAEDPLARFGMIASARDSVLAGFSVPNDYNATKRVLYGPWFGEGDDDPLGRSCRLLRQCVTEFGCQGLELDATLLAWGNDFIREGGAWTNRLAKRYQRQAMIRDAFQLRRNAYRVLLTRARDATVVFVPPISLLDETFEYLVESGFRVLERSN